MKFKKLATLALSAMVVASMGSTAVFAETNTAEKPATPADSAYLVKYLKLADGVTNPNVAFTFNFEAKDNAPAVGTNGKVTITPTTASESEKDGASAVGNKKLSDILPTYEHAGVYTYTVTENASADGFENGVKETTENGVTTKEKLTFSTEKYTMEVRVANDGHGGVKPAEVSIMKDGETTKTDATDPDPTVTQEEGKDPVDHGEETTVPGFSFTNVYEKTTKKPVNPNPEDPTQGQYGAAGITKTVVGAYGDQTFAFPFSITMTKGVGVTGDTVEAKLITNKDVAGATKVTLTYGEPKSFNLKHGQSLVFEELPTGVSYKVSENLKGCGVKDEAKYLAAFNGTAASQQGASLVDQAVTVKDAADAENDGHFTNTLDTNDVTPTGIVINNLPYVLLIVIALGGIVLFTRKRRAE